MTSQAQLAYNRVNKSDRNSTHSAGVLLVLQATQIERMKSRWDIDQMTHYRMRAQEVITSRIRKSDGIVELPGGVFAVFLAGTSLEQGHMVSDRIIAASYLAVCDFDRHNRHDIPIALYDVRQIRRSSFNRLRTRSAISTPNRCNPGQLLSNKNETNPQIRDFKNNQFAIAA